MALFRPPVQAPGSPSAAKPLEACKWQQTYPSVAEFLSLTMWPDGSPRVTGTITLLFDEGMVKAALNDRDTGSSAFVSGKTCTDLFKRLEACLTDGSCEWRVKKESPASAKGRRS